MLANALPVGFSAEELGSGILQPGLESFSQTGVFPVLRELVFLKDIFPAETFHNAYPSAGMPMGRAFAEWLKDLKEK